MLLGRRGGRGKQGLSPLGPSSGCEARIWDWRKGGPGASRSRSGWVSRADGPAGGRGPGGAGYLCPPCEQESPEVGPPSHVPLPSLQSEEALEKISYANLPKDDSKLQGYRPATPPPTPRPPGCPEYGARSLRIRRGLLKGGPGKTASTSWGACRCPALC